MDIDHIVHLIKLLTITLLSTYITFTILPKYNPYYFPPSDEIDQYTYIDDNNVCYTYKRVYL